MSRNRLSFPEVWAIGTVAVALLLLVIVVGLFWVVL